MLQIVHHNWHVNAEYKTNCSIVCGWEIIGFGLVENSPYLSLVDH